MWVIFKRSSLLASVLEVHLTRSEAVLGGEEWRCPLPSVRWTLRSCPEKWTRTRSSRARKCIQVATCLLFTKKLDIFECTTSTCRRYVSLPFFLHSFCDILLSMPNLHSCCRPWFVSPSFHYLAEWDCDITRVGRASLRRFLFSIFRGIAQTPANWQPVCYPCRRRVKTDFIPGPIQ